VSTLSDWMKEHGEVESYEARVIDAAFGLVVQHRSEDSSEIIKRLFYNPHSGVVNINDRIDFPGAWEVLGDKDAFARKINSLTDFQKKALVNLPEVGQSIDEWSLARRVYGREEFERDRKSRGGRITALVKALRKLLRLDLVGCFHDQNDYPHWFRKGVP
jgi:hypothetical protein